MPKLLDILLDLPREDLLAVSAISIERSNSGNWQARLNIFRNKYSEHDLHEFVGMQAWERVPEQCYPLDLDEVERDADIRQQAAAVQESGIIGKLNMARFDSAAGHTRYLIKSHAGSQQERSRWALTIKERPENTIWQRYE